VYLAQEAANFLMYTRPPDTADTKQKQMAGFTASLRSAAGADDSLNQSLE
jgi:hypothetical protein